MRFGGAHFGVIAAAAAVTLSGCAGAKLASVSAPERADIEARMMRDISVLASDEFEGRKPGTLGGEKTLSYITGRFRIAGLLSGTNDPGNPWRAPVQLVQTKPFTSRITFTPNGREIALPDQSAAAFTQLRRELVEGAPVIFVGKQAESVTTAEIAGKVVVMLGEPGKSPQRRAVLFERDPAAIITVVSSEAEVQRAKRGYNRERVMLKSDADDALSAFVSDDAMGDVFGERMWFNLTRSADNPSFQPVELSGTATIEATSERREFTSYNVIGKLPGRDPAAGALIVMGHWDHLGECGREEAEDRICNGAVDNASGIAMMFELAQRLRAHGPFDRDIYFVATTAEESGLLGARAFAKSPPVPLENFVAAFNLDTVALAPSGSAVGVVGEGETPLDGVILQTMKDTGRKLGDGDYANRFIRRQDGWALLQEGVPAVLISTSFASEIVLGPYFSGDYHRAGDEVENIELGGAIDDLLLHEELIKRVANTATYTPPAKE